MTEDEGREWLHDRWPQRFATLERYVAILTEESVRQNLIAASTLGTIWVRHIVDSAQLLALAPDNGRWVDIGAGAGLPGVVVATLSDRPVTLVEPRRLRAAFLRDTLDVLGLGHTQVVHGDAARYREPATVVSARAVASIGKLFDWTRSVSRGTTYVLPKGRDWQHDLANAQREWTGAFHVERSMTDAEARIIVASEVRPA